MSADQPISVSGIALLLQRSLFLGNGSFTAYESFSLNIALEFL